MGHDIRVHREYYRLSDETTQLAKISKLLISLDKGNLTSIKGKNLDEINVDDLVEDAEESESETDEEGDTSNIPKIPKPNTSPEFSEQKISSEQNVASEQNVDKLQLKKPNSHSEHKKVALDSSLTKKFEKTRNPWSVGEKTVTIKYFSQYLHMKILPGKKEIEIFLEKNSDLLVKRKWSNIKDFLYNELKKMKTQ